MNSGKRCPNMSAGEKALLADLTCKHADIDNKRTDSVSIKVKKEAWGRLAYEFNSSSTAGARRDTSQLKHVRICSKLTENNMHRAI